MIRDAFMARRIDPQSINTLREAVAMSKKAGRKPLYKSLYVQVLFAVAVGVLLGHFQPNMGAELKPLGDAFIKLVKMIIAPIIFCTVVIGIAGMEDMKKSARPAVWP